MTKLVEDPGRIAQLAGDIVAGSLGIETLVERYLARIEAVDNEVEAWRLVDAEGALAQASALQRELGASGPRGPLHGIPLAVKDVIDVAGFPTRAGSRLWEHVEAASSDAEVVHALRAAGAIPLGKVHTTEFAFFDTSPARNPHNPDHTPGGSSSGSGAAVAGGMAPAALGTQTVASVNRPAAYCGIAAFKPSTGSLSTFGVTPLAPMYDTVGFFGARVEDAVYLYGAVRCIEIARTPRDCLTVMRLEDPLLDDAAPDVVEAVDEACRRFEAAGHRVVVRRAPVSMEGVRDRQWCTARYQMAQVHADKRDEPLVGERFREALATGAALSGREFAEMRRSLGADRQRLYTECADADVIVWPAAPATAPEGIQSTGDPRYIGPWTALGGPVITAPAGAGANGLPLGVLFTGAPGADLDIARAALALSELLE